MSNYQSEAYECARNSASVSISPSEWINEFSDGIKLKKGDNVRLLGSFVHEGNSGEEIEVAEDKSINVAFSPYLQASTFSTNGKDQDNLLSMGSIGDIPYSTDAFGIEPPHLITDQTSAETNVANYVYPDNTNIAGYTDPLATRSVNTNLGHGLTEWYGQGINAQAWGINYNTNKFDPSKKDEQLGTQDYYAFGLGNANQELYISQIVKKFILPIHKGSKFGSSFWIGGQQTHEYADLVDNPPSTGAGCMNGVPKVGMYITTIDIGMSSGWMDDNGNMVFENNWGNTGKASYDPVLAVNGSIRGAHNWCGIANLKSGAQSLIGRIIATRPIRHAIQGHYVDCYEVYATDWVSPASINNEFWSHADTNTMTGAYSLKPDGKINGVAPQKTYHKVPHGAGINEYNYQVNPSFNTINGAYIQKQLSTSTEEGGYVPDMDSGVPTRMSYSGRVNTNIGWKSEDIVKQGSYKTNPNELEVGYGIPQGLSFPWNGSYCGQMFYGGFKTTQDANPYPPPPNQDGRWDARYRGNANSQWYWTSGNGGVGVKGDLYSLHSIMDGYIENSGAPNFRDSMSRHEGGGLMPMCFGAYMILSKEAIVELCNGRMVSESDPNFLSGTAGRVPRVWFDWSNQGALSNYWDRHYVNNKWDRNTNGASTTLNSNTTNASTRFQYDFCGRPLNINYRASHSTQAGVFQDDFGQAYLPGGFGPLQSGDPDVEGCNQPVVWSSGDGYVQWTRPQTTRAGQPTEYQGYNTSINSIHFQQKETGDTTLGFDTIIEKSYLTQPIAVNDTSIQIDKASLTSPLIPADGFKAIQLWEEGSAGTYDGVFPVDWMRIESITDNGATYTLTFSNITSNWTDGGGNPQSMIRTKFQANKSVALPVLPAKVIVKVRVSGKGTQDGFGAGNNANAWATDMLMIKESVCKVKIPSGFYTEEQLAENINTQLHLRPDDYAVEVGERIGNTTEYAIPSNVGNVESAYPSQPSILNGNFVHTYIPDVSFGFSPITDSNAVRLGMNATTTNLTEKLIHYDCSVSDPATNQFFLDKEALELARPYNGTTNRYITDNQEGYETELGKHVKVYAIPFGGGINNQKKQTDCIRLIGGALNVEDLQSGVWQNRMKRFVGTYEMLRSQVGNTSDPANDTALNNSIFSWRTRLNRNLLNNGGGCKIFVGANNPTFSWEEGANRYALNNLYTPLRPHEPNDGGSEEFGIDDAVPSAIINMKPIGKTIGQLCGIYINDLNADAFNQENWGKPSVGNNWLYDTDTEADIQIAGAKFLSVLGFTEDQLQSVNNSFNLVNDIFIYNTPKKQSGQAIRVAPKITTSVNGSNPHASYCLNVAPVVQFFVEVDTNDFFAVNVPEKGADPYYFIGSDFPTHKFYGNLTGDKLPVIGICARNFHAFNFVFDLGGSSISYTIEEDTTITSIRTKIYTSTLGTPASLSPYSSVIYLITRNNNPMANLNPQIAQQVVQQNTANNEYNSQNLVGQFYNPATADIRTEPPVVIPKGYYQDQGIPPPPDTETDTDEDY